MAAKEGICIAHSGKRLVTETTTVNYNNINPKHLKYIYSSKKVDLVHSNIKAVELKYNWHLKVCQHLTANFAVMSDI